MRTFALFTVPACLFVLAITSCAAPTQNVPTLVLAPTGTSAPLVSDPEVVLFRGNAQRSGVYETASLRGQPQVKWRTEINSTWLMLPMLADGILYTGSGDGSLYALDAETGEQVWSADGFEAFESTGAIAGDKIITG